MSPSPTIPYPSFHIPHSHASSWGTEAPLYRSSDHTLHFLDPLTSPPELHILSLTTLQERVLKLEDSVTVVRFRKGEENRGSYICAWYQGVGLLDEETGRLKVLREVIGVEERGSRRFNDGAVDAAGRFWLAEVDKLATPYGLTPLPPSHGPPRGRLWRYDPDTSIHEMDTGFICGNGIGWSADNKTMYFNDSVGQTTYAYDFDLPTGSVSNRRIFASFKGTEGEPDGLAVDAQGNIWIAVYGSSCVMIFAPSGVKEREIVFSAKAMTCPTFGGKDLDELYVTSARSEGVSVDEGGNLFRFKIPWDWRLKGKERGEFAG